MAFRSSTFEIFLGIHNIPLPSGPQSNQLSSCLLSGASDVNRLRLWNYLEAKEISALLSLPRHDKVHMRWGFGASIVRFRVLI